MASPRKPRGYVGLDHETLGSDIMAVSQSIQLVDLVLGQKRAEQLKSIKPELWYPIQTLLEPLEFVSSHLGESSLKRIGWNLFKLSHGERFAKEASSVRDLAYGIDVLYHRANRGTQIGGWEVTTFEPGKAVMVKTTPHHCVVEEGILEEALRTLKVPAFVAQEQCFRKGADACVFVMSSAVRDRRWTG